MISLIRTIRTASLITLALSDTVLSGPYDGLYFIGNSSCDPNMVGMDGGPYKIEDDVFWGTEMGCELKNPVNVRGMNATLYDGECGGEGEEWERRYLIMESEVGIYWIEDGHVMELIRCP